MPARTKVDALAIIRRTLDIRRPERRREAYVRLLCAARISREAYAEWRTDPSEFAWTLYQGALAVEDYWNEMALREGR